MKNLRIIGLIALSSMLFLSGCKKEPENEPELQPVETATPAPQDTQDDETEQTNDNETVEADTPPREGMVRSRITNEWVDEEIANRRPVSIMIPNTKTASQYGISTADVLYECNVESSITRPLGIWENWDDLEK